MGSEEPFAEVAVGVREARLVRPHERVAVDASGRVLADEVAVHLEDEVGRETAATEQVIDLAAGQLLAVTVAHFFLHATAG